MVEICGALFTYWRKSLIVYKMVNEFNLKIAKSLTHICGNVLYLRKRFYFAEKCTFVKETSGAILSFGID